MKDIELEEKLKAASLSGFSENFEAVASAVESEEKRKSIRSSSIKRAAACLIILAVSAAVAFAVLNRSNNAKYESDAFYDSAEENTLQTAYYDAEQEAEEAYEDSSVGEEAAADIKETYYIKELDMYITIPQVSATDRDVTDDYASLYGMSADELYSHFVDQDVYFNAVWENNGIVSELIVSMVKDGFTYEVFDLSKASEIQKKVILTGFENFTSDDTYSSGTSFYDVREYKKGDLTFIRAGCTVNNSFMYENRVLYMTVVNGQRITVTLIEHFPAGEGTDVSAYSDRLTDADSDLITSAVNSIEFGKIQNKFLVKYRFVLFFIALCLIGLTVIEIWVGAVRKDIAKEKSTVMSKTLSYLRNKKNTPEKDEASASDESEADDGEPPEKSVEDDSGEENGAAEEKDTEDDSKEETE